jgi:hypothetical protein
MSVCLNDTNGDGDCAACARNPEAPCRVSAREELFEALFVDFQIRSRDQVNALLDAYAHELAEKQRAWAREPGQVLITVELPDQLDSIVKASVDIAADLIDPEALNGE